jgi:hypothetical protein
MKTNELTGAALNWAVNYAEGLRGIFAPVEYCDRWSDGGPIIEREKLFVKPTISKGWRSYQRDPFGNGICHSQYGPTPLIAAMRCYVASKLGDEVEIPKELL